LNWRIIKIYAFMYRNYIFARRNIFAFFEIIFWPAVGIVSVGLMGSFLDVGSKTLSFLLTGAIFSGILQVTQLDVSYGLLYDVWSKSLKQTFLAPVDHYDYIIGSWIFGIIRGAIVFVMLAFFSRWAFDFFLPPFLIVFISLAGVVLSALIIGMSVNFFVLFFGQRIDVVAWSFSILVMLLCGIYYPVSFLPDFFIVMASFIPLTYFLEYFRTGYGFSPEFSFLVVKGFLLSLVYIFLLFYLLQFAYDRARKNGLILRLSE